MTERSTAPSAPQPGAAPPDVPADDAGTVAGGDGAGPPRAAGPSTVRPMGPGIPTEKARDFRSSSRRLLSLLRQDRVPVWSIVALASVGVALTVVGPKILGHATDIVIRGVQSPSGIDFADLHRVLLGALALFLGSSVLTYGSCVPDGRASSSGRCGGSAPRSRTSCTASPCPTSTASSGATCSAGSPTTSTTSP